MQENKKIENREKVEIKEISKLESDILNKASELISKYSWGYDYPKKPIEEIEKAEYLIGAFCGDNLVGFASVGRGFSPDEENNESLWFSHAIVIPEFRNRGIFKKLYEKQIIYAKKQKGKIFSCTDNPIVKSFFLKNGWKEYRKTKDEASGDTTIYMYVL